MKQFGMFSAEVAACLTRADLAGLLHLAAAIAAERDCDLADYATQAGQEGEEMGPEMETLLAAAIARRRRLAALAASLTGSGHPRPALPDLACVDSVLDFVLNRLDPPSG